MFFFILYPPCYRIVLSQETIQLTNSSSITQPDRPRQKKIFLRHCYLNQKNSDYNSKATFFCKFFGYIRQTDFFFFQFLSPLPFFLLRSKYTLHYSTVNDLFSILFRYRNGSIKKNTSQSVILRSQVARVCQVLKDAKPTRQSFSERSA